MEAASLTVEVHFVPVNAREAEEQQQRLHELFLAAALRVARNGSVRKSEEAIISK